MIEELIKLWEEYEEWLDDSYNLARKDYSFTFEDFMRWLRICKS